jgi:hypothetical protein
MSVASAPAHPVVDAVVPWACLSLAGTFFWWSAGSAPAELAEASVALTRYLIAFTPAALAAGVACGVLVWFGAGAWMARLSATSALCYLGFLKVAGLVLAPWVALGLVVAAALVARPKLAVTPLLLMVHAMGTIMGMYFLFSLDRYLPGWEAVLEVLRGFWWAVTP